MALADQPRAFHCSLCSQDFTDSDLEDLCGLVNQHNLDDHKDVYTTWWAPSTIRYSNFYSGVDKADGISPETETPPPIKHPKMNPKYSKPWGTARNSEHFAALTPEDEKFLDKLLVKWEE